jgi:hypothetical protein
LLGIIGRKELRSIILLLLSSFFSIGYAEYDEPCYLVKNSIMVWDDGPIFSQYKTPNIYKGKVARPDVNTNADARMYRTKLREGVKDSPNFAAKYTIVTWGCGMSCSAIAVVDAVSGQVFFSKNLSFVVGDKTDNDRFSFKQDSNLLIVAGRLNDDVDPSLTYYVWDGNEFNLVVQHVFSESDCEKSTLINRTFSSSPEPLSINKSVINPPVQSESSDDWRSRCNSVGALSESIMSGRQHGVSMSKMMDSANPEIRKLVEEIIIEAYDSPRYSTDAAQIRSIEEFRNEVYLQCAKSTRPK